MPSKGSWNPVAFAPTQVTIITSAVYIALFAVLLWNHYTLPSAPSDPAPVAGINLTQAWLDLDAVSARLHPDGSRANDDVRSYLLERIDGILKAHGKSVDVIGDENNNTTGSIVRKETKRKDVTLWKHDESNITTAESYRGLPWTIYTESSNIVVYIRGKQDGGWDWRSGEKYEGHGGVLVNAHYDSVSTGYGATDDGVGVVTVLQLISHFTTQGNEPEHGIVALLNNNEEDGLYGALSYVQHPIAQFPHTFLNLEGAGAGGKAILFRSTDAEVTKFYAKSPHPAGSVIIAEGFRRGLVRSGTDYSIFTESLGMRGLDVAFFQPRARYHTDQDSARETSPNSLWHMLSASIATMRGLTDYDGDEFNGGLGRNGKLDLGKGSVGAVWFDLFGRGFAVLRLNTLFALSVTLLVAGPVILIILEAILVKSDKWYPFSLKKYLHSEDDDEPVRIRGLRGFFRFPVAFVVATAVTVALAFLQAKINQFIVYSSDIAVWVELLTVWTAVAWFFLAGGDRIRPTALQRMFVLLWLYILTWCALVAATVGENNLGLGSPYFIVIYNAAVFAALLISYFELFGLPTKHKYAEHVLGATVDHERNRPGSRSSRTLLSSSRERPAQGGPNDDTEATESTSLLRGRPRGNTQGTFTGMVKRSRVPESEEGLDESGDPYLAKAYGDEQAWSSSLAQWTWILQFILLAPINVIIVGQLGLLCITGLMQTPADGNPVLPIYIQMAALAILLVLPLTPFLHRLTYQLPTFLFLISAGCLIYNLTAFPFSREARMKHFFVQTVDLDTGNNSVTLTGLDGFLQDIIAEIPSASGQRLDCTGASDSRGDGLIACSWSGLAPHVDVVCDMSISSTLKRTGEDKNEQKPKPRPETWLDYSTTVNGSSAVFTIQGMNSKMCKIALDAPASEVHIAGSAEHPHSPTTHKNGSKEIHLFGRDWNNKFKVNVTWAGEKARGQTGKVTCLWSESDRHQVPALDEIKTFEPVWSAVTKAGNGLVEGFKRFELR